MCCTSLHEELTSMAHTYMAEDPHLFWEKDGVNYLNVVHNIPNGWALCQISLLQRNTIDILRVLFSSHGLPDVAHCCIQAAYSSKPLRGKPPACHTRHTHHTPPHSPHSPHSAILATLRHTPPHLLHSPHSPHSATLATLATLRHTRHTPPHLLHSPHCVTLRHSRKVKRNATRAYLLTH